MKRVILESPYAGDVEKNIAYARRCMKDSLDRGEAPFASHLLYTQKGLLDDNNPIERRKGIEAGFAWLKSAQKHVFYIDHGMSRGMIDALRESHFDADDIEFRFIERFQSIC